MIVIRRGGKPIPVKVGRATVLVRPLTLAMKEGCRAAARRDDGTLDEGAYILALHKAILAGWSGVHDEEGVELAYGPDCPECRPVTPVNGEVRASQARECDGCGGTGLVGDFAVRRLPGDIWALLSAEATRVLGREEALSGN